MLFQRVFRRDGGIEHRGFSGSVREIYGVGAEALEGPAERLIARIHADDRAGFVAALMAAADDDGPTAHEFRVVGAEGRIHWLRCSCSQRERGIEGSVWDVVQLDVTDRVVAEAELQRIREGLEAIIDERTRQLRHEVEERRQIEKALRESEERYRNLLEGTSDWVWEIDEYGRYSYSNSKSVDILGYSPEELLGVNPYELMPPEEVARISATIAEARRKRQPLFKLENVNIHKDGRFIVLETSGVPVFDENGGFRGYRGIDRDITDRKQMEQALQSVLIGLEHRVAERTAELMEANRRLTETLTEKSRLLAEAEAARAEAQQAHAAKARFLAAASHDLRQPMQAIRLFVEVLKHRLKGQDDRAVAVMAEEALVAGEDLLRSLLDVSVLEAGVVEAVVHPVALEDIVEPLIRQHRGLAAEKGLVLRVVPSKAVVRTDPTLLARVLRNLIVNAIKYTKEGGVLIGCRRAGDMVRIEVWDSGCGIPDDQLEAIFEDFFQLGNPERNRANGLGLGLSTVQRMAKLLDHPLSVRSRPGKGSVFAVSVPLDQAVVASKRYA